MGNDSRSDVFDFKEQAKALLKRLAQAPGAGLALAAVEAALREAYAKGSEASRGVKPAARQVSAPARKAAPVPAPAGGPAECAHDWEETFLDGRSVGGKCSRCGLLEREVQDRCEHYFVQVGAVERCVACRKDRPIRR